MALKTSHFERPSGFSHIFRHTQIVAIISSIYGGVRGFRTFPWGFPVPKKCYPPPNRLHLPRQLGQHLRLKRKGLELGAELLKQKAGKWMI